MTKQRIDLLLVEKGLFTSREKARGAIMAGQVLADRQRVDKPGAQVSTEAVLEVKGETLPYVSRGGLKLEKAMDLFQLDLANKTCMDIGASTGGFTDCMLQKGAAKVYTVDVGYGQLDWKLRNDPRVVVMERTNIRHVISSDIPDPLDFVSIDVSFISLKLVLPVAKTLLAEEAQLVVLIKPQFEAGREQVGKNGVVRDRKVHCSVITQVVNFARELDLTPIGLSFSPIRGPKGNVEFLLVLNQGKNLPRQAPNNKSGHIAAETPETKNITEVLDNTNGEVPLSNQSADIIQGTDVIHVTDTITEAVITQVVNEAHAREW